MKIKCTWNFIFQRFLFSTIFLIFSSFTNMIGLDSYQTINLSKPDEKWMFHWCNNLDNTIWHYSDKRNKNIENLLHWSRLHWRANYQCDCSQVPSNRSSCGRHLGFENRYLEQRLASHLWARPRRCSEAVQRREPLLQHLCREAYVRGRHCFCLSQHSNQNLWPWSGQAADLT